MTKPAWTQLLAVILLVIVACALLGATESRAASVGDGPNVVLGTGDGLSVLQSPSPGHPTLAPAVPNKFITVTPKWAVAFFLISFAIIGIAWCLGRRSGKDRIDALKDRIKFARLQCSDVEVRVSELKDQVAIQKDQISELDPASERTKELASGNTKIKNAIISLSTTTQHLSNKLTIVRILRPRNKGRFVLGNTLIILRPVQRKKRSSYRYGSRYYGSRF